MSVILEVLGKGLEADLCDVLSTFYQTTDPEWSDFQDSCKANSNLELLQGLEFLRCGDFSAAEKLLENVCKKNPQSVAAHAAMVAALDKLDKIDRVFDFLKKLNQICPYQAVVEFAFGLCYEKLGEPQKAAVRYRCATSLNESYVAGWARLAAVGLVTQNYDEAADCYERLIRIVPQDNRLRGSLGGLYLLAGKPEKAGAVFDSAIALEPENWADDDGKVPEMIAAGKIRLAIDYLQQSLETKGDFADIHVKLGNLYSSVGDDIPAMEHYRYALSIHGDYLDALVRMGSHHLVYGRWEEAAETFWLAAEHNERLLVNYLGVATACKALGKLKHAEEYYNLAAQMEPNSSLLYSQMIHLHHKIATGNDFVHKLQSQLESAVPGGTSESHSHPLPENELTAHARRVDSEPNCAAARFHHGVLLRAAGQAGGAIKEFYQTVRLQPLHSSGLVKLGVLLWEQDRRGQAETIFDRIFYPDARQLEIHYRLGLHFHDPKKLREIAHEMASSEMTPMEEIDAQNHLMMSLGNMGLVDRGALAWKSLNQTQSTRAC